MKPRKRRKEQKPARKRKVHYGTDIKIVAGFFVVLLVALWLLLFFTGIEIIGFIILCIATFIILVMIWLFFSMKLVVTDAGVFASFLQSRMKQQRQ